MTTLHQTTDRELRDAVKEELGWLPSVAAEHVGVTVERGAVTLTGQVSSYPEKTSAVEAAFRVRGVNAVADEIDVHHGGPPVGDTDIARAVNDLPIHTMPTRSGSVKADVRRQVVLLSGSVAWNFQREAIQDAVAAVPGVRGITNRIDVEPDLPALAPHAATDVLAALRRHAEIDAAHVLVTVEGTVVTLTGTVGSWAEQRRCTQVAWAAPGVAVVDNRLAVSS